MNTLAITFRVLGQLEEEANMRKEVLEKRRCIFG
jgi:hypothetical protein